jgi:hypothetical protein
VLFECVVCHNLNDISVNVFKQEISYCLLVICTSTVPFVTLPFIIANSCSPWSLRS